MGLAVLKPPQCRQRGPRIFENRRVVRKNKGERIGKFFSRVRFLNSLLVWVQWQPQLSKHLVRRVKLKLNLL